ncbi:hypothetical protein [Curtobacterium sp. MCBD17_019]|uniref:hypothetical protein n=1 Tax=Curtobacterium sp. MCBD17_019 TaxID=2175669 RepID=UPI0011B3D6A7|nr:hypothetical protein [Curtobacterium sp. MCBD17_019]
MVLALVMLILGGWGGSAFLFARVRLFSRYARSVGFTGVRTIPREAVVDVQALPFIDWVDAKGVPRRSWLLTFFGTPSDGSSKQQRRTAIREFEE